MVSFHVAFAESSRPFEVEGVGRGGGGGGGGGGWGRLDSGGGGGWMVTSGVGFFHYHPIHALFS